MRSLLAFLLPCFGLALAIPVQAAEWQWSVEAAPGTRAFLWVPPDCQRVRAVVVGQHNMVEETILEHAHFRQALARQGIAEVWIVPPTEGVFRFDEGAGERFERVLSALGQESGYEELAVAPVVPIGHSACASYPWNFGAWNPGRTLAVLSVHGDAPLTDRTGSGKPNPDWGDRTLDGVPGLMVMGEFEWSEDRLRPALAYRAAHPGTPLAMLAEPGRGHFDVSEDLVRFLALFVTKAAEARLPASDGPLDVAPVLRPVDPRKGWLVQRWHLDQTRTVPPAPFADYAGDPAEAFWCFDEETARATQGYRAGQVGKRPQLLGYVQDGKVVPQGSTHQQVTLRWLPESDGVTFRLAGTFLDAVDGGSTNSARWTGLPAGSPLGHAASGPVELSRITGPVAQTGPGTFTVCLNRANSVVDKRGSDVWLLASHPGDDGYKSAVQQSLLHLPLNTSGTAQRLTFPIIPDQKAGTASLRLQATSDAENAPSVGYYVREGPAEVVDGDTLRFTTLPPRTRFPVKVTVVAWQWGRSTEPRLQTAEPVTRTFLITK